jgi:hypothetical protein
MFVPGFVKSLTGRLLFLFFSFFAFPYGSHAQTTINWVGSVSGDWNTAANWSSGFVPGLSDNVQIGIVGFTSQPSVGQNVHIGTLTFGGAVPVVLTVSAGNLLQVDGNIIQSHSADYTPSGTTVSGDGGITCGSMFIGNYTTSKILKNKNTKFISKVATLTVVDSLTVYSTTTDLLSGGIAHNNGTFSLEGGVLSVGGLIKTDNQIPAYLNSFSGSKPYARFVINITSNQDATFKITKDNLFRIKNADYGIIDFYNHVSGTGKAIVQYTGGNQLVYTNTSPGIDQAPYTYQNLSIQGTGVKVAGTSGSSNRLNVDGDLDIVSGTLDLSTNNTVATVIGSFTNRGVVNLGTSTIVNGGTFFNSGQFNQGNGLLQFSGNTQQLSDSTSGGTNFKNVIFSKAGTKTIQSGQFAVNATGKMSIIDSAVVNVLSTGQLTLHSDSTGSAAITAIPLGSGITGQVNVEQFFQGGLVTGGTTRGYRLLSSTVNHTVSSTGERQYNYNYIIGTNDYNGWLTAGPLGTAGGFTTTGAFGNPTMYIYREDKPTCNSSFSCGNNVPVLKINNTNPNDISALMRFSTSSVADTITRIPIGTGLLSFYVGNRIIKNNSTAGSKISAPYNIPESTVITNTGTVNQGTVQVRDWFRQDHYLSYTVASFSNPRGFNLVGNPYPCSINWDKWNPSDTTTGIYGPNLNGIISIMNPVTHQYNTYQANASHDPHLVYYGTGLASNIVSSGQGFHVQVDANSANPYAASLLFKENAKSVEQSAPVAPAVRTLSLLSFKSAPVPVKKGPTTVTLDQLIRLQLVRDIENQDEILVRFRSNAKQQYISKEDAYDLGGTPDVTVMLSSYSSDHVPLDINWMPFPKKTEQILLYTNATVTGKYQLKATEIKDIPAGFKILLKDKMTGKLIDLRNRDGYTFAINREKAGSFGDRFELILTNQKIK